MTTKQENRTRQTEGSVETVAKKPYESPELTVHGRVDEITQFLASGISPH